jgi:hypothetical protein
MQRPFTAPPNREDVARAPDGTRRLDFVIGAVALLVCHAVGVLVFQARMGGGWYVLIGMYQVVYAIPLAVILLLLKRRFAALGVAAAALITLLLDVAFWGYLLWVLLHGNLHGG